MSKVPQYAIRKNADDNYWTIFNIQTGLPAVVDDIPMDKLDELEAIDVLGLVNSAFITPRSSKPKRNSYSGFESRR
jgi:hypothetical protein